jgi:hypothetical protein
LPGPGNLSRDEERPEHCVFAVRDTDVVGYDKRERSGVATREKMSPHRFLLRAANGAGVRYLMQPVSGCEWTQPRGELRSKLLFNRYGLSDQNVSGLNHEQVATHLFLPSARRLLSLVLSTSQVLVPASPRRTRRRLPELQGLINKGVGKDFGRWSPRVVLPVSDFQSALGCCNSVGR